MKEAWKQLEEHVENQQSIYANEVIGKGYPLFVWMLFVNDLHLRVKELEKK